MIPGVNSAFQEDFEIEEEPSFGFRMNIQQETITGTVDEVSSIKQAIYMILNTERYEYVIYDWDYGVEFQDLYGEPVSYCCPEIERRITEALMMDERIVEVGSFVFDYSDKGSIHTAFIAHTMFGDIDVERTVTI